MDMCINKILATPTYTPSAKFGAKMGRRNVKGEPTKELYLQRVGMVDGDYDGGGVYWGGGGSPMWCAFSHELDTMVFVRADSRTSAKAEVLDELGDDDGEEWGFLV